METPYIQMSFDPDRHLMASVELSLDPGNDVWTLSYGVRDLGTDELVSQVVHCTVSDLRLPTLMRELLLEMEHILRTARSPF